MGVLLFIGCEGGGVIAPSGGSDGDPSVPLNLDS